MNTESFIQRDWISKLSRLSIATKSKLRGQHKGSHRSSRFGASLDFSDFREYAPGDDVRQIDWNVYARTDKYFIKRFLDEQEMRVHILLDSTKSMGETQKWLFAKQLVASLGLLVLQKDDRLSFSTVTDEKLPFFRRKGATYKKAFLQTVSNLKPPHMTNSFSEQAVSFLPKDSTVLFIITDGLESLDLWESFLRKVPKFASDIRLIQVVTDEELNPTYTGDVQLEDIETSHQLNVSISSNVLTAYEKERTAHQRGFELLCRRFGVKMIQVKVEDGISHVLFHQLLRANWVQ